MPRPPHSITSRLRLWVTRETTGGALLVVAAVGALMWANSPWRAAYVGLSEVVVGPASLGLNLAVSDWATDGLLAVFFFVVGLELKSELVTGTLSNPRQAAVPMVAAVAGMVVPAVVYLTIVHVANDSPAAQGWAIPTATDIAFALAVLAIFGRGLPRALRTFLLTLAVVDDLVAILVIAAFYTAALNWFALMAALVCVAAFAWTARLGRARWHLLVALAIVAWAFMHASGIHATIAGVLLGLSVPARPVHNEPDVRTHRFETAMRPISSGLALPVFAFFAAGVSVVDGNSLRGILDQPMAVAIMVALVVGKPVGVLGMTALVTTVTPLRLPESIGLRDLLPIGFLAGIGFTVSLLLGNLAFPDGDRVAAATIAVLASSLLAALLAAATLRWDAHKARQPHTSYLSTRPGGAQSCVGWGQETLEGVRVSTLTKVVLEADDVTAAESFYRALGVEPFVEVRPATSDSRGFRGFTMSLVCAQPANVDALVAAGVEAGASTLKPAAKSLWGYGAAIQSPDGSVWTVAASSKKNSAPAAQEFDDVVLLLGVADVKASVKFYTDRGFQVAKSYGGKYAELEAAPVKLALNPRKIAAKNAGLSPEGSGSHRFVALGNCGDFTDPDGFVWENSPAR